MNVFVKREGGTELAADFLGITPTGKVVVRFTGYGLLVEVCEPAAVRFSETPVSIPPHTGRRPMETASTVHRASVARKRGYVKRSPFWRRKTKTKRA